MEKNVKSTIGQAVDAIINSLCDLSDTEKTLVIKMVAEYYNIRLSEQKSAENPTTHSTSTLTGTTIDTPNIPTSIDIKTLKEQKKPGSAIEMACIVAYYLEHLISKENRKNEISQKELKQYFMQAAFPLPGGIQYTLYNAVSAGYFDPCKKGFFKLNPVGYNLVAHTLPRKK